MKRTDLGLEFQEGDIVLLLYNNTLGYVERIHNWPPLHDVHGLDESIYRTQFASEILLIHGLDKPAMGALENHLARRCRRKL